MLTATIRHRKRIEMDNVTALNRETEFPRNVHARRLDPPTSHKAATDRDSHAIITRGSQKHRLLNEYANADSLTADEACVRADLLLGSPWKRVSDMHQAGYLETTGHERVTRAGRAAAVLRITDRGRRAHATLMSDPELRQYRP